MKKLLFLFAFAAMMFTVNAQTASTPLKATVTANDGATIASLKWEKLSGPQSIRFSPSDKDSTMVSDLVEGVYVIQLTATDSRGLTDKKTTTLTVMRAFRGPVIVIEGDKTIRIPNQ